MKKYLIIFALFLCSNTAHGQQRSATKTPDVPCNGDADDLPGKYYDHTQPKYPMNLKAASAQEKAAMLNQLIALEKLEEKSRSNFTNTGCVLRTSFSTLISSTSGGYAHTAYSYQLAAYQNVCHVTQHIIKTVDEYRTVLRVNVNPSLAQNYLIPGGTGEFYLTDKSTRYDIPIDAKQGPGYNNDKANHPSRVSQYVSEAMVLTGRSDNYKNKHADFLTLINGNGYVENWMAGSRGDKPDPKAYKWVDRHYLLTRPGMPLLVPVTRRQYLEDLLEYFEVEKANFYYDVESKLKSSAGDNSEYAKKRRAVWEADKAAYPQLYETKKTKIKQLLATQKTDWLQKPAVVDYSSATYDANQRLANIGNFYDVENEKTAALYTYNPEYFKANANQPTKPVLIEVQFRYELGEDRGFSGRLFNNFLQHYDLKALQQMVE